MNTNTTLNRGAADLPEALRSIQRFEVVDCIDDKHVPAVIPKPHGPWVRYEDHIAALAAGQATAAQAVVQDDLITLRKPTTSAELLWLLKLAHLVISDVDKTLEETFAPAQPAAQQGAAYATLPEKYYLAGGEVPTWDAKQMHAFADATCALRASQGQAPATQQAGATGKCMGPRCMASSANGYAHSRECIDEAAETQGWTPAADDYAKCGPSAPQPSPTAQADSTGLDNK